MPTVINLTTVIFHCRITLMCDVFTKEPGDVGALMVSTNTHAPWGRGCAGRTERRFQIRMLNIRSLRRNLPRIISRLVRKDIDVIVLVETWLYPELGGHLRLDGYKAFFNSNPSYRAGGVAIYVKRNIPCHEVTLPDGLDCDCCIVELRLPPTTLRLAAVYRSPTATNSDARSFVDNGVSVILHNLRRLDDALLMGDMNFCLLEPTNLTDEYCEKMAGKGFISLNDYYPTRITERGRSLIDHVWARARQARPLSTRVSDSGGVSDHCLVEKQFSTDSRNHLTSRSLSVSTINYEAVLNLVENTLETDWSFVSRCWDSESATDSLQMY